MRPFVFQIRRRNGKISFTMKQISLRLRDRNRSSLQERTSMEIEIPKKLRSSIMFSVDIALNIMRNVIREDEVRTADVKLSDSHCRILAEDLYSSTNVPSRRTSAKYGYAVLASDGKGVRKVLPSSSPETSVLTPGTCMRIRSGAPIPVGATAVVKLENTRVTEKYKNNDHSDYFNRDNKEYEIEVLTVPEINENIRDAGYHIKSNQLVLEKYSYIGPIEMGILDLCNFKTLPMTAELLVGLLSIGDELNELEKLYESSSKIILRSLLEKNYYVTDYKISSYEIPFNITLMFPQVGSYGRETSEGFKKNVIVIIGRVNDKEMLKTILKGHFEATIHFGRVNMKPGKSTTFATCMLEGEKKYILCMSSNPATVPVVAQVFLLPLLKELHCNFEEPISIETRINSQHELHSRPTFSWATLHQTATGFSKAYCSESQNQNVMRVAKTNVLLTLPPRTLRKPMLNDGTLVQATVSGLK
ncbi:gephyrin [Monomorium pharaonis]|uniref:gephyrin n=1 Tax=Monomorium pharaonis TaxID=307658 RepID=UPI001747203B|nr:gephyrin [Monomorium pharaonis]